LWAPFAFEHRVSAPPDEELIVHEFIVYNGAFCTIALAWIAARWRQQANKALLAALVGLAAVSLILAFGRHGGVYPLLAQLPVIGGMRAPSRYVVLFQMALAGIAAMVLTDLAAIAARGDRIEPRTLWPLAIPIALSAITIAITSGLAGSAWATSRGWHFSTWTRALPWSLPLAAMTVLVVAACRGRRWALPAIVVLAALDQAAWGYSYIYRWGPVESIAALQQQAQVPREARAGDVIPPLPGGRDHLAILRGLRLTSGYTGLYPKSVLDFSDPAVQRLAGLTWRGDGDRWERVPDALPRARLIAPPNSPAAPGRAVVELETPGRFIIQTTADGPRLLALTERYHEGWRVTIDGVTHTTVRVDSDFLGAAIGGGTHRVEFAFADAWTGRGFYLTTAGLAIIAALLIAAAI
jgi:hypothetical protein